MTKPILINSYPRSGSVFLAELINSMRTMQYETTVVHLPQIIGIDEVITITIIRNPKECITSDIFKWLLVGKLPENINELDIIIKSECKNYLYFLEMSKLKKSYLINFDKLIKNPKEEIIKFLNKYNFSSEFNLNIDNVLDVIKQKKFADDRHDLYTGHFPRGANQDPEYIKIWEYIKNNDILNEAYAMYEEIIKEI